LFGEQDRPVLSVHDGLLPEISSAAEGGEFVELKVQSLLDPQQGIVWQELVWCVGEADGRGRVRGFCGSEGEAEI
jgi:hypothetical protein